MGHCVAGISRLLSFANKEDFMPNLLELTAEIVGAYVAKNPLPASALPELIGTVNSSLGSLGAPSPQPLQEPAVNPKRSVRDDYIVCLEDGRKFKSLKRHLTTHYNLSPEEYRAKWNLPADYPMVAPNYAAARSALAKKMGLGRKAKAKAPAKRRQTREKP